MWDAFKKGFLVHLQLEKSLSPNTIDAYGLDLEKLIQFMQLREIKAGPEGISLKDLQEYIKWIAGLGMSERSQARIISGIKAFYRYCAQEEITKNDPTELLSAPKLKKTLPDTLTFEEIELLIAQIDQSKQEGGRTKALLETLYSCGLRVSEAINLRRYPVPQQARGKAVQGDGVLHHQGPGLESQHSKKHFTPYLQAFFCHTPGRRRCRPEGCAGNVGP